MINKTKNLWKCIICGKAATNVFERPRLMSHVQKHMIHKCKVCHKLVKSRKSFKKHMRMRHNGQNEYAFKTSVDKGNMNTRKLKVLPQSDDIIDSTRRIDESNKNLKLFCCQECDFQTFSTKSFYAHMMSYHATKIQNYQDKLDTSVAEKKIQHDLLTGCKELSYKKVKKYTTTHKAKAPKRTQNSPSDNSIVHCEKCRKQFNSLESLKAHQRTHGEDRIKCDKCPFNTHNKTNLNSHVMLRHNRISVFRTSN